MSPKYRACLQFSYIEISEMIISLFVTLQDFHFEGGNARDAVGDDVGPISLKSKYIFLSQFLFYIDEKPLWCHFLLPPLVNIPHPLFIQN
jgi:hypothetical protein